MHGYQIEVEVAVEVVTEVNAKTENCEKKKKVMLFVMFFVILCEVKYIIYN